MTAFDIFALILVIIIAWGLEWIMVNIIFNGSQTRDEQHDLVGHSRNKENREPGFRSKATSFIQKDQVAQKKPGLYT